MVKIASLGSGSKGNCLVLAAGDKSIAIDAGFSCRCLLERLQEAEIDPASLQAVLITHEHTDHVRGCQTFCSRLGIPAYMTTGTHTHLLRKEKAPEQVKLFLPGTEFQIGNFAVRSFPISHDASEPVGFVVRCHGFRLGVATDLGIISSPVESALRDCNALVVESNYDPDMLRKSPRTLQLKRRIAGISGHLRNRECAEFLPKVIGAHTRNLWLAHVSAECNDPECIQAEIAPLLSALPDPPQWEILAQDQVCCRCFEEC